MGIKKEIPGQKKVMILIVAYNAEKTIVNLLERMPKDVIERVQEIVLADDASSDRTSALAEAYRKKKGLSNFTILRHAKNKGYGGNQKWGYTYALEKGYDIAVMIHGDAQYPPEYIAPLIAPLEDGRADFMFGSRMAGHPLRGGMPLYKFFGNVFLTSVENIVLGTKLTEFHSGFRAYSMKAIREIPFQFNSDGFHFDSEIIIQLVMAGKKINEIVIPTFYGDEKCNVKVVNYGMNILKELGRYMLVKSNLRSYPKYHIPIK